MPPAINTIGSPFIELQQVDSTNNYAMGQVHAGMAQHGFMVFAHHQTGGKGQRNRQWISKANENITVSIVVKPFGLQLSELFYLSMASACGVQAFFSKYAGIQTKVKWPNDIYFGDRKAGGILIENVLAGTEWKYAVIGIGLNINQQSFGDLDQKAISLGQITNKNYDVLSLVQELCLFLQQSFDLLQKDKDAVMQQYHSILYKRNEKNKFKKGYRVFAALIKGVNSSGELIVQHGIEEKFGVGEIEWIIE